MPLKDKDFAHRLLNLSAQLTRLQGELTSLVSECLGPAIDAGELDLKMSASPPTSRPKPKKVPAVKVRPIPQEDRQQRQAFFQDLVRLTKQKHGWTLQQTADALGCSLRHLRRVCSGSRAAGNDLLEKGRVLMDQLSENTDVEQLVAWLMQFLQHQKPQPLTLSSSDGTQTHLSVSSDDCVMVSYVRSAIEPHLNWEFRFAQLKGEELTLFGPGISGCPNVTEAFLTICTNIGLSVPQLNKETGTITLCLSPMF